MDLIVPLAMASIALFLSGLGLGLSIGGAVAGRLATDDPDDAQPPVYQLPPRSGGGGNV